MKKNGFTVVELLTSIVLIIGISFFLLQIVFILNGLLNKTSLKTELLSKQGLLSKNINEKLLNNYVTVITTCGLDCLNFKYANGKSDTLVIDREKNVITFSDYSAVYSSDVKIGEMTTDKQLTTLRYPSKNDGLLNIIIPIHVKNIENDYGVRIVYQFNRSNTSVNL